MQQSKYFKNIHNKNIYKHASKKAKNQLNLQNVKLKIFYLHLEIEKLKKERMC